MRKDEAQQIDELTIEKNSLENASVKEMRMLHLGHFGKIFSNLSIFFTILSLASVLTLIMTLVLFLLGGAVLLILLMVIVVTLGIIFVIIPNYWGIITTVANALTSSSGYISKFGELVVKIWPVITPLAIVFAGISILFLCFDKTQNHTIRIVFSSVVLVIAIIILVALIVLLSGGAK